MTFQAEGQQGGVIESSKAFSFGVSPEGLNAGDSDMAVDVIPPPTCAAAPLILSFPNIAGGS